MDQKYDYFEDLKEEGGEESDPFNLQNRMVQCKQEDDENGLRISIAQDSLSQHKNDTPNFGSGFQIPNN